MWLRSAHSPAPFKWQSSGTPKVLVINKYVHSVLQQMCCDKVEVGMAYLHISFKFVVLKDLQIFNNTKKR